MSTIADGKKIAKQIEEKLISQIAELKLKNIIPKLAVILVGDNKASASYVRKKGEAAKRIGVEFVLKEFPAEISQNELIAKIGNAQKDKQLSGLMVQLPLPKHLNSQKIINHINPDIDVDGLTERSWGRLANGTNIFEPPTAGAMLEVIRHYIKELNLGNLDFGSYLSGKEVVIIGRGELVGKPLDLMLLKENCTITVCHSRTKDLTFHAKRADIIFTGVGKYNFLTGEMIKNGAAVIDAGVCFYGNKMYGDIDFESVGKKTSLVTPTPGGVGPITVAKLLENTVKAASKNYISARF